VASHLLFSQPFASYVFGPQWPSPPRRVGVEAQPWDIPSASPEAGSIEEELAVYEARLARRVAEFRMKRSRQAVCCGKVRTSDCECGCTITECEFARPRAYRQECECGDFRDRMWERARDQPEPECHHPAKILVRWECDCHGKSMVWRKSETSYRPRAGLSWILSAVRPTTTYMAGVGSGWRARRPAVALWGADQTQYFGVKHREVSDHPRQEAQMLMEIEIAIAEATGDWRRLV